MTETLKPPSPTILSGEDIVICRALSCRFININHNSCRFMEEALERDQVLVAKYPNLEPLQFSNRIIGILKFMAENIKIPPYFCPKGIDTYRRQKKIIIAHD